MSERRILWAPWRASYIRGKRGTGCIFCNALQEDRDRENLVVFRGAGAFVILNRFPYNAGHLMVVPHRHCSAPEDLEATEAAEIWSLLVRSKAALGASFQPHGFNIGINVGQAAGAGIADHLHLHVVPRWTGDTNFMPVLGGTDVVSLDLTETYEALASYFAK